MKRILYVSRYSYDWQSHEIEELAAFASKNNCMLSISGMLITFNRLFFQILEGPENNLDSLYQKIKRDKRHSDISLIETEENVPNRLFDGWHMRAFNLDERADPLEYSIKILLNSVLSSYSIIEKYNQPGIIKKIRLGINPAEIKPQKIRKIVLFTDMVGFSRISEEIAIEKVLELVSDFFEIVTSSVEESGGDVEKFIGDCVMASFARDKAENAINAGLEILRRIQELKFPATEGCFSNQIHCGIGIAIGNVLEGNVGSAKRLDYTILGDAVNTAQRLEQMTRLLPFSLATTAELKDCVAERFPWVNMGIYDLKGKQNSAEIFSIDLPEARKFKA